MKKSLLDRVCDLLNHDRAELSWICRADIKDGKPIIVRMARIVRVMPRDGAGRLRVAVSDWGVDGQGEARHHVSTASGYGYDKTTAALAGATIGGIVLSDHGRDGGTLRDVCREQGWEAIGSIGF